MTKVMVALESRLRLKRCKEQKIAVRPEMNLPCWKNKQQGRPAEGGGRWDALINDLMKSRVR